MFKKKNREKHNQINDYISDKVHLSFLVEDLDKVISEIDNTLSKEELVALKELKLMKSMIEEREEREKSFIDFTTNFLFLGIFLLFVEKTVPAFENITPWYLILNLLFFISILLYRTYLYRSHNIENKNRRIVLLALDNLIDKKK